MINSKTAKVKLEDIKIPKHFTAHFPSIEKLKARIDHFKKSKTFDREILVDKDNVLLDGYTTYLVARMIGMEKVRVLRITTSYTVEECFDLLREATGVEKKGGC